MKLHIFTNFGTIDGTALFIFCFNEKVEKIGKADIGRKVLSPSQY